MLPPPTLLGYCFTKNETMANMILTTKKSLTSSELYNAYEATKSEKALNGLMEICRNVAMSILKYKSIRLEDAEDLSQIVCERVWKSLTEGRYGECGKFEGYVARISNNAFRDWIDKEQKCRCSSFTKCENYDFSDYDEEEDAALKESRLRFIEDAIEKLSENLKNVVKMRLEDVAFKDIAKNTNVSLGTALARQNYAVKAIVKEVAMNGQDLFM